MSSFLFDLISCDESISQKSPKSHLAPLYFAYKQRKGAKNMNFHLIQKITAFFASITAFFSGLFTTSSPVKSASGPALDLSGYTLVFEDEFNMT